MVLVFWRGRDAYATLGASLSSGLFSSDKAYPLLSLLLVVKGGRTILPTSWHPKHPRHPSTDSSGSEGRCRDLGFFFRYSMRGRGRKGRESCNPFLVPAPVPKRRNYTLHTTNYYYDYENDSINYNNDDDDDETLISLYILRHLTLTYFTLHYIALYCIASHHPASHYLCFSFFLIFEKKP